MLIKIYEAGVSSSRDGGTSHSTGLMFECTVGGDSTNDEFQGTGYLKLRRGCAQNANMAAAPRTYLSNLPYFN